MPLKISQDRAKMTEVCSTRSNLVSIYFYGQNLTRRNSKSIYFSISKLTSNEIQEISEGGAFLLQVLITSVGIESDRM